MANGIKWFGVKKWIKCDRAKALKINTYINIKEHLISHSSNFEIPDSLLINSEPYFLYFTNDNETFRGNIFLENKIQSNKNDAINIDYDNVDAYISHNTFCYKIATFANVSINRDILYWYPNGRAFTS